MPDPNEHHEELETDSEIDDGSTEVASRKSTQEASAKVILVAINVGAVVVLGAITLLSWL